VNSPPNNRRELAGYIHALADAFESEGFKWEHSTVDHFLRALANEIEGLDYSQECRSNLYATDELGVVGARELASCFRKASEWRSGNARR
jgi:hypothetical protein